MQITISGDPWQIKDACRQLASALPRKPRGRGLERKLKQDRIMAQRKLLRTAFDLIRYDPAEKRMVSNLARALGGDAAVTGTLLESAKTIVAERG